MTTPATKSVVHSFVSNAKPKTLYNPALLVHKNLKNAGGNIPALREGVDQRANILPKGPTLESNPKHIGFYQPNVADSAVDNAWVNQRPDFLTRHVKIFWATNEKAQKVPSIPKENHWILQFERQGIWKNPNKGWTFSNDTQSKRPVRFKTVEEAIIYCRQLGLGYEINYPRTRYHTRKNYGDNFKWQGLPKEDEEHF